MAADTGGIIAGMDPLKYHAASPYTLFFFQLIIIIVISQLLSIPMNKIKQPRVISEVLTGIVLGQTALGRIPGFTENVFPPASIPSLTLVANVGICLLMFIVGCEVDIKFIKAHLVTALSVGLFNLALPFGVGCLCAIGLWNDYRKNIDELPSIEFTTFMVFIAVALCITAFPVLVRILTELRLVKDRVGTVVLAAGITNDLVGWVLLALSITLANSTQSLVTLYIVLVAFGWFMFICYPVRIALHWFLKNILKELDDTDTPSRLAMTIILGMVFASAFFTDIIGVHPIFGAFIIGTIIPRENNYVINLTIRIEDLVNIIFVPVYFAISGLSVDLGLLNTGLDWGWTIGLIAVSMISKILGGMLAAKLNGLYWRESLTVGVLMSCKGIVEIVVLQVGLNAKIISQKTYSMFIFMALIDTFFTTPLTLLCYPVSYREKVQNWIEEKNNEKKVPEKSNNEVSNIEKDVEIKRLILTVEDMESLSTDLLILGIFSQQCLIPIHAINIKTLTDRTADVLHASMMKEDTSPHDFNSLNSILSVLKIFCHYNKIPFTSEILYSLPENYIATLLNSSTTMKNDLFFIPIQHKQYSQDYLKRIFDESKKTDYYKALFINNNQGISEILRLNNKGKRESFDNSSKISDDTILDPSAMNLSSVTLYLHDSELTKNDRMAMKIFNILVKNKETVTGRVVLNNIDPVSKTADEVSTWIVDNDELYKNIDFKMTNRTNSLDKVESGKALTPFILDDEDGLSKLDRLIIVSSTADIEFITELVSHHEKVIVMF
ncbi:hypothetical protein CANINC_002573 [Pichia inconspicua]|uniref:Cation/H+ exchanger transmembrane domain-containing protein n=1 Tax=Pichia inconspicua TaxID=52247 RepID=A0A4T0X106_9ASCO|nr:hypothetical protein CANINC_002573 [[Candida] inconspicua]